MDRRLTEPQSHSGHGQKYKTPLLLPRTKPGFLSCPTCSLAIHQYCNKLNLWQITLGIISSKILQPLQATVGKLPQCMSLVLCKMWIPLRNVLLPSKTSISLRGCTCYKWGTFLPLFLQTHNFHYSCTCSMCPQQ
jgi:hypothetical protein